MLQIREVKMYCWIFPLKEFYEFHSVSSMRVLFYGWVDYHFIVFVISMIYERRIEDPDRHLWCNALGEKCPNKEFFLVSIFLYSIRIQENTDKKKLRIWTRFTQWPFGKIAILQRAPPTMFGGTLNGPLFITEIIRFEKICFNNEIAIEKYLWSRRSLMTSYNLVRTSIPWRLDSLKVWLGHCQTNWIIFFWVQQEIPRQQF